MSPQNNFSVNIIQQGWLKGGNDEEDYCSHGKIRLSINGETIIDENEEFGISESALAMLRTLRGEHSPGNSVAERMIFHGCGTILMMGCSIGVNWTVKHINPHIVKISDIIYYPETNESMAKDFSDIPIEMPFSDYRNQICAFANKAKELFTGAVKKLMMILTGKDMNHFGKNMIHCLRGSV